MTGELFLPVTGRAQVLVDEPSETRAILVGFHGYGEPPERALRALRRVDVEGLARWAPRGVHHFYDHRNRVVSSWMTRFDRDAQIQHQVAYLRSLFDAIDERHPGRPVFLLGFSQGGATAWRAGVLSGRVADHVFLLAGDMPPEVAQRLHGCAPVGVTMFWGLQDTVVALDVMERDLRRLEAAGWPVELHRIEGGHDYLHAALDLVARRIERTLHRTSGETSGAP